jgi:hypothetical protein
MEATLLPEVFGVDKSNEKNKLSSCLFTRPRTRGVVAHCFDLPDTSLIEGFRVTDELWILIHALQQALLYDGANVMFLSGELSSLFLRRGNTLYAWTMDQSKHSAKSRLFDRKDVLVLCDELAYNTRGKQISRSKCQMIVVDLCQKA